MIRSNQNNQIFEAIVSPVAIDVMDVLITTQWASKHLFHDEAMLFYFLAIYPDVPIAIVESKAKSIATHIWITVSALARVMQIAKAFGEVFTGTFGHRADACLGGTFYRYNVGRALTLPSGIMHGT